MNCSNTSSKSMFSMKAVILGIGIGAAIGVALKDSAVGIGVGAAAALAFGLVFRNRRG